MSTTHKGLTLGQRATATRTFTAKDVIAYTALTGDASFDEGVIPGPLLGGMISDLLGTKVPGRGTMWLKQRYSFSAPALVGEAITATVEIVRLRPEKDLVNLQISCANARGDVVCRGESLVFVGDLESAKV